MLKINLLPPYIFEKRKIRRTAILFGVLVACVAAGMFGWYGMLTAKERDLNSEVLMWEQKAAEVKSLEDQAAAEEAKAPTTKSKVDFIEKVMAYNLAYPKLYEELAKYTYSRILYRSVEPSPNQLKITARARSVGDCGRYVLNMYRASHVFASVRIDSVPGWSGSVPNGFDFNVTCDLRTAVNPPTFGTGTANPAM